MLASIVKNNSYDIQKIFPISLYYNNNLTILRVFSSKKGNLQMYKRFDRK